LGLRLFLMQSDINPDSKTLEDQRLIANISQYFFIRPYKISKMDGSIGLNPYYGIEFMLIDAPNKMAMVYFGLN